MNSLFPCTLSFYRSGEILPLEIYFPNQDALPPHLSSENVYNKINFIKSIKDVLVDLGLEVGDRIFINEEFCYEVQEEDIKTELALEGFQPTKSFSEQLSTVMRLKVKELMSLPLNSIKEKLATYPKLVRATILFMLKAEGMLFNKDWFLEIKN